jgi:hypothetical protein
MEMMTGKDMLYYVGGRGVFWGMWMDQQLKTASADKYQLRTEELIQSLYLMAGL